MGISFGVTEGKGAAVIKEGLLLIKFIEGRCTMELTNIQLEWMSVTWQLLHLLLDVMSCTLHMYSSSFSCNKERESWNKALHTF